MYCMFPLIFGSVVEWLGSRFMASVAVNSKHSGGYIAAMKKALRQFSGMVALLAVQMCCVSSRPTVNSEAGLKIKIQHYSQKVFEVELYNSLLRNLKIHVYMSRPLHIKDEDHGAMRPAWL